PQGGFYYMEKFSRFFKPGLSLPPMKWILPALFICCTPLLCYSQTKKLPLYEYGITLLPDDYLYDTGTLADYTQVTMELHNGEMDTTVLRRVRFSSGRMVSADRYEYDPADREKN